MNGLLVTCDMVMQEACVFASEEGIPRIHFKTNRAWPFKFMKRTMTVVGMSSQLGEYTLISFRCGIRPWGWFIYLFVCLTFKGGRSYSCLDYCVIWSFKLPK